MITSLEKLRQYLKIDALETGDDVFLASLCSGADAKIKTFIGNEIELQDVTYTFSLDYDLHEKVLPYYKVNSVSNIQYNANPVEALATLSTTDYAFISKSHKIYSVAGFTVGYNYAVTANVGYSDADMPLDIQQAGVEIASVMYKESDARASKGEGRLGIKQTSESTVSGNANVTYEDVWEKWKRELFAYKILPTGA